MGKEKEHSAEEMDMPVLGDESDAAYVSKLLNLAFDVEAGWYLGDWLEYCVLPWPWHLLPFLEETEM